MLRIPISRERTIQGSSSLGLPTLSLTLPQDRTGEAIAKLGGSLQDVAKRVTERRDRVAVEDAYGALYDEIRDASHGENGFFLKKGGDVEIGATKIFEAQMAKLRRSNEKDLKGRDQQDAYNRKVDELIRRTLDSAARHESSQLHVADLTAHEAYAQMFAEEARLAPGAPQDELVDLVTQGQEALEQGLRTDGVTDRVAISNARQEYASGVWKDIVLSLAERNPALAQEKFDTLEAQGKFTSEDKKVLTDQLDNKTLTARAQSTSDDLWAQHEDDFDAGMAAARNVTDSEERDDVVRRMSARYAEKRNAEARVYDDYVDGIGRQLDTMFREGTSTEEEANIVIDEARPNLEDQDVSRFRTLIGNIKGGKVKVTNQGARVEAMERIDKGEIPNATELQLEYGDRLTPGDLEEVVKYQINGGNVGGLKNSEASRWFEQYVNQKPGDRADAFSQYWDFLITKLEPGKKPTSDDVKGWALEWLTTPGVTTDGGFLLFDKTQTRAESIRAKNLEDFTETLTNEEKDAAVTMMNQHNKQYPDRLVDINDPTQVEAFIRMGVRK